MPKHTLLSLALLVAVAGCVSTNSVDYGQGRPSVQAQYRTLSLSREVFDNADLAFRSNTAAGPFGSYLTMEIRYEPVREVFSHIQRALYPSLITRKEAHITVITPVEYRPYLEPKIKMAEINEIAQKMKIQEAKFEVVGLGSGNANLDGKLEETFFIVVRSEDLLNIRKEIERIFVSRGGNLNDFKAEKYFPHITVGFTKRDLHEADGVIKDERSLDPRFTLVVD